MTVAVRELQAEDVCARAIGIFCGGFRDCVERMTVDAIADGVATGALRLERYHIVTEREQRIERGRIQQVPIGWQAEVHVLEAGLRLVHGKPDSRIWDEWCERWDLRGRRLLLGTRA